MQALGVACLSTSSNPAGRNAASIFGVSASPLVQCYNRGAAFWSSDYKQYWCMRCAQEAAQAEGIRQTLYVDMLMVAPSCR